MLSNWMSICLYQYLKVGSRRPDQGWVGVRWCSLRPPPDTTCRGGTASPAVAEPPFVLQDSAGEPLYKLFKAIKHQVEKGPVDAVQKKAKYTLNDTGLLGDDVEYAPLVSTAAGGPGQPQDQTPEAVHRLARAHLSSGRGCASSAGVGPQSCPWREALCVPSACLLGTWLSCSPVWGVPGGEPACTREVARGLW